MKTIGKPCAGKPQARFERGSPETDRHDRHRAGDLPTKPTRAALIALVVLTLACNTVTGAFRPATATPPSTVALPPLVATSLPPGADLPTTLAPTETAQATFLPTSSATAQGTPTVYVPPACRGTPVATLLPATLVAMPTPSLGINPPISQAEQVQVFDALVSKIEEVYLYPDYNGLDWPGTVAEYRAKIEGGLAADAFYTEMSNLVTALGDEHSHFESPLAVAASDAELAGINSYVGIGVQVKPLIEKGRITVLLVFPDSTAAHSGLKAHDSLLAVDGLPLVDHGQAYPYRTRGPECSAAVVTVQSPGEVPRDVTLVRARVSAAVPIASELVPTQDGSRIGYIFLPTFYDDTVPGQVRRALENFGPLDGLILDNRTNGGGSSRVVEPILSYFTSGTLGNFVSRTGARPLTIEADPVNNSQTVPMVVLVGQDTASFGEIFTGILQDAGRAKVVGQQTLGHVETLFGYDFSDGSRAWIAQERFDPAQTHVNWEKRGITPDVVAYADWDTFTLKTDPGVAAAVALLGH
jgi:carboxyl-terminal processing protease